MTRNNNSNIKIVKHTKIKLGMIKTDTTLIMPTDTMTVHRFDKTFAISVTTERKLVKWNPLTGN